MSLHIRYPSRSARIETEETLYDTEVCALKSPGIFPVKDGLVVFQVRLLREGGDLQALPGGHAGPRHGQLPR